MEINLGNREFLTPSELAILVNGCRAIFAEDRYVSITIVGTRKALSQVKLITRWDNGWNLSDGSYRSGIVEFRPLS